jgi:hypothetical protein
MGVRTPRDTISFSYIQGDISMNMHMELWMDESRMACLVSTTNVTNHIRLLLQCALPFLTLTQTWTHQGMRWLRTPWCVYVSIEFRQRGALLLLKHAPLRLAMTILLHLSFEKEKGEGQGSSWSLSASRDSNAWRWYRKPISECVRDGGANGKINKNRGGDSTLCYWNRGEFSK